MTEKKQWEKPGLRRLSPEEVARLGLPHEHMWPDELAEDSACPCGLTYGEWSL